jgi:hypothetical protein
MRVGTYPLIHYLNHCRNRRVFTGWDPASSLSASASAFSESERLGPLDTCKGDEGNGIPITSLPASMVTGPRCLRMLTCRSTARSYILSSHCSENCKRLAYAVTAVSLVTCHCLLNCVQVILSCILARRGGRESAYGRRLGADSATAA